MEQQQHKSCHSSPSSGGEAAAPGTSANLIATTSSGGGNTGRDAYLRNLNKSSLKISKPIRRTASFDRNQIESLVEPPLLMNQPPLLPPHQHQPPVYNINKSDFRDVVQRLTGSPAHERFSTPQPIQQPKPQSSRLQRIRPPPLVQISNRPPPQLSQMTQPAGFLPGQRQPLSPLPPFPSVHAAAESPISAYMRFLQTPAAFDGSPGWNGIIPPQLPPLPHFPGLLPPSSSSQPFGCTPSPRSPYGVMSQNMMFPPSQLPLSPNPPVASPSWKGT